ncbi:hypothetical protein X560_1250 [Listeria fleischmannii 1991]|uniref:Protein of uncharacterized function (DUF3153) n=2 Tax=Listeria fleischmannii TaxID=1069827 RepID=A0A2X3HI25_9LIST|nr:DUF3153 domain-containing protein [Listeria fleischmannii]EMG27465.1 protein with hydrophobic anchor [Listeria fleischmannii subsp. fleischmannii LU2006-1]KMT59721.1 hypothetical protein X560_1250 [Listeria fleischmannii 1991]SQC72307.1 Protein of uncharacterised function (DUF3153) [Listeria fleischmannii subsp. fleischmannii]
MKRLLILLMSMTLLLTGCADVVNTVKVNKDGTADLNFDIKLGTAMGLFAGPVISELEPKLEEAGFTIKKTAQNQFSIHKKLEKPTEQADLNAEANQYGVKVKETDGFFMKKIRFDATLDVPKILKEQKLGDQVPTALLSQVDYTLVLDFPIDTIGENNADSKEGGKLTWHIPLEKQNRLYFEIGVPNVKNIAISAGVFLILLVAIIIMLIRRRKKRKIS